MKEILPSTPVMRTQANKLKDYIKASAILHQWQREKDDKGRFIATLDDYDYACIIFEHLNDAKGGFTNPDEEAFFKLLSKHEDGITIKKAGAMFTRRDTKWIYNHKDQWKKRGLLREKTEQGNDDFMPLVKLYPTENSIDYLLPTAKEIWDNNQEAISEINEKHSRHSRPILNAPTGEILGFLHSWDIEPPKSGKKKKLSNKKPHAKSIESLESKNLKEKEVKNGLECLEHSEKPGEKIEITPRFKENLLKTFKEASSQNIVTDEVWAENEGLTILITHSMKAGLVIFDGNVYKLKEEVEKDEKNN